MKKHLLLLLTMTAFFLTACGHATTETVSSEDQQNTIEDTTDSEISETLILPEETSKSLPIKDANDKETDNTTKDVDLNSDKSVPEETSSSVDSSKPLPTNPDNIEGSYILSKGNSSVCVVPPANWLTEINSKDMLTTCDSIDYRTLVTFYMYTDITSNTLSAYMESDILPFYQKNNSYINHGYADDTLFTDCLWISCQDGSTVYYTWMEVNGTDQVVMEIDDYSGQDMYELIPQILSMIDVYES